MADQTKLELLNMTGEVVSAFVSHNSVSHSELPQLIASVHAALQKVASPAPAAEAGIHPKASAADIRRSIRPEGLISFEDGKTYKALKRHLTTRGLTVKEYQAKWGLAEDYPMVAPAYSQKRSDLAKAMGLGQKGRVTKSGNVVQPGQRGRKAKVTS